MKIVACVKYSLDMAEVKVDPLTREIPLTSVPRKFCNIDRNILEAAAQLKEAHGGSVHLISYGPSEAKNLLKEALGMNADSATLVLEPAGSEFDPAATAMVLGTAIKQMGEVDVIVCGEASDDGFTYQVPPRLAELLDVPFISYVRTMKVEGSSIGAERDAADGVELVASTLPAVVTVTEETNQPRRPTLMDLLKAKKKPLAEVSLEELGLSRQMLEDVSMVEFVGSEGVVMGRKQMLLHGKPSEVLANELVDFLLDAKLLERCE